MELQAYLRPSSAAVWSKCAGYAALNAALGTEHVEETDNDIREDGTACHWLAAELWAGRPVEAGALAPNGREITEEMFLAVDEYHDMLHAWNTHEIAIEQQVGVSQFFPGVADGTPDAASWTMDASIVFVGDLKYGFRPVEVWRNAQLIVYAWTIVCLLTQQGHVPQEVRLFICQPRCPHRDGTVREWRVSVRELGELAATLAAAALACYAPNPPCTVGPQCRNCVGAFGCRTLQAAGGGAMEVSYDATPFVLTEPQLAYELSKLMAAQSHIENRINGLSTQAESLMRRGKIVPGFELGRRATRWRWRAGTEQLIRNLAPLFGIDVMQEPKIKTVAKLRDVLGADVVAMYAEKPEGELVLRRADPNEAIERFMSK